MTFYRKVIQLDNNKMENNKIQSHGSSEKKK